jgi:phospholipid transport system transporter-binding protein
VIDRPSGDAVPGGGFTVTDGGWRYAGALTFDDAAGVFAASQATPLPASGVVDFAGMTHADSSVLAIVIALRRRAAAEGRALSATGLPASLHSLAVVYGVENLLD